MFVRDMAKHEGRLRNVTGILPTLNTINWQTTKGASHLTTCSLSGQTEKKVGILEDLVVVITGDIIKKSIDDTTIRHTKQFL